MTDDMIDDGRIVFNLFFMIPTNSEFSVFFLYELYECNQTSRRKGTVPKSPDFKLVFIAQ